MSFQEALEAKIDFRRRQRARRAQGALRRRGNQRRDDDKPKTAEAGDETPSDGEDSPSEDESSTKSTQSQTQASTSSRTTQAAFSASTSSSIPALTTTSTTLQSSTTVRTSVAITTASTSQSTRTTAAVTTSTSLSSISRSSSSIITTTPPFSIPLAVTSQPTFISSSSSIRLLTSSTSTSSTVAAAETAGSGISSKQSSDPNKIDHSTAIIFGVVGAFGVFVLLAIAFFIRSKYFKYKGPKPTQNEREARAYTARSIWGTGSTVTSTSDGNSRTTMAQFVPPLTMPSAQSQQANPNAAGNDAVDRQERLQRVRVDILGDREMQLGTGMGAIKQPGRAWGAGKFQKLDDRGEVGGGVDIEANEGMWDQARTVAQRDSRALTEVSLPRWRDPVTWARDQSRRNEGRGASNM